MTNKIGRNDPCHCGSGKKYKKCCGLTESVKRGFKADLFRQGGFAVASGTATRGLAGRVFKALNEATTNVTHEHTYQVGHNEMAHAECCGCGHDHSYDHHQEETVAESKE